MTPNELAKAENGNFFIRERVRRVLDLLAPGQCDYFPTCYQGTSQRTPWLLAVPNHQVVTGKVDPAIPRCEACGEPRSAHPGTQWSECLFGPPTRQGRGEGWTSESEYDVLKSATWGSSERGWDQWISRDLFMSVRLLHLLKKIKARGFYEATCQKPTAPHKEESAWINEQLEVLETHGIPLHPEGTLSDEDAKWLRAYLKAHAGTVESRWDDVKEAERRLKVKLPRSYVDFVNSVGGVSFENVDEGGFAARILPPDELDWYGHAEDLEDEESKAVNGLMFATTTYGDCFCFDVQKGKKEFPVVLFKHEYQYFEPYAENFAACIRRFAGGPCERDARG